MFAKQETPFLSIPIIHVDSEKARELDISIALRKIYYQPNGYQRTAKKLYKAFLKARYNFSINKVRNWLERQLLFLIHKAWQSIFLVLALTKLLFLWKLYKLIYVICLMIKLERKFINML